MRRTRKLVKKLGLTNANEVRFTRRPKGLHRRTFERLRWAVLDANSSEDHAAVIMLRRALGSLRIRT